MHSLAEENYLKTIYHLSEGGNLTVSTTALAEALQMRPASVTDMIKKLSGKKLITHEKYYGVTITRTGKADALAIIRKHRLWETFLVDKLKFSWDEVHEVAEQLEHIQSALLMEKLDAFLGYPTADPHGHPIPDAQGKLPESNQQPLSESAETDTRVQAVRRGTPSFLQYLSQIGIHLGAHLEVVNRVPFDGSVEVRVNGNNTVVLSREAADNILVIQA